ncbi:hypothetical protein [Streptomyces humi]|uniref:hypothetical protein n=1 Tax=Streptomyces humi TaxID=1428620 RepID=UPI0006287C3D|nr:hypothetical protein [Streptomyces humi]
MAVAAGIALERRAEEETAERVGDRRAAAHAVGAVPRPVPALMAPPPTRRRLPACGPLTPYGGNRSYQG